MKLKTFQLGIYQTKCYLVWNEKNEATLFDCGGNEIEQISKFLKENNLTLKNLILTHGHGDHIAGINEIKNKFPEIDIFIGEEEKEFLINPTLNLSLNIQGKEVIYSRNFKSLNGGDYIFEFEVINTPGHTIGSKCFYHKDSKIMISGDTLFRRSYGRTDLPTGNFLQLRKSLNYICENYPEDTLVYSGHTECTTIGEEIIFLKSEGI